METVRIDGSIGEGGGQVLRVALALSALTARPLEIDRIRAGRSRPGLRPQHLAAVRAVAAICRANVTGDSLDSQSLTFHPQNAPLGGSYTFDVRESAQGGSAGSVTLIAQAVLWPLVFADRPAQVTFGGGTHVPWSPPYHYLDEVFRPTIKELGIDIEIALHTWGWYPAGGGEIAMTVNPAGEPLASICLEQRGELVEISGLAVVTNLPAHIPQRMAVRAESLLKRAGLVGRVRPLRARGPAPGAGITLTARYENGWAGFSALGRRGKPSETVAEEALQRLVDFHGSAAAPVDPFLCDQLILPLCLAQGRSIMVTSKLTGHARTVIHVVQQFIDVAVQTEPAGSGTRITIEGLGYHV